MKLDLIKFDISLEELVGIHCPSECKHLELKEQELNEDMVVETVSI